jgi:hypothetical protein
MGEITFIGVAAKLLGVLLVPYWFTTVDDLWIPIGPVFQLPYNFLAWCNYY